MRKLIHPPINSFVSLSQDTLKRMSKSAARQVPTKPDALGKRTLFGDGPTSLKSLQKKLRAEYRTDAEMHRSLGISEEAYVSREIDRLCSGEREDEQLDALMKSK